MKKSNSSEARNALINGAERLVANMDPSSFLLFLTGANYWQHYYTMFNKDQKPEDDHFYTIAILIEQVARPWLLGKPDYVSEMADGLLLVIDHTSAEGMTEMINKLLVAFGYYTREALWNSRGLSETLKGFSTLNEMLGAMEQYEILSEKVEHLKAA